MLACFVLNARPLAIPNGSHDVHHGHDTLDSPRSAEVLNLEKKRFTDGLDTTSSLTHIGMPMYCKCGSEVCNSCHS